MKRWRSLTLLVIFTMVLTGCMGGGMQIEYSGNLRGIVGIPQPSLSRMYLDDGQIDPSEIVIAAEYLPPDYIPLRDARVYVDNRLYTYTNSRGEFYARDIPVGRHILKIDHEQIRPLTRTVYIQRGENGYSEFVGGRGYYIIIGIDNYPHMPDGPSFPGPVDDARAVYNALFRDNLMASEGAILENSTATKRNIKYAIKDVVAHANSTEDYLVIYFSGLSGRDFLRPWDDDNSSWEKSITDGDLEAWLRDFPGNVTVIIDGSDSASMADGNRFEPFALRQSKYTVISAARTGERVVYDNKLGNSVFTFFLVEGLEYQYADKRPIDGVITAQELYDYLYSEMRKFFKDFSDFDSHHPTIHRGSYGDAVIFRY